MTPAANEKASAAAATSKPGTCLWAASDTAPPIQFSELWVAGSVPRPYVGEPRRIEDRVAGDEPGKSGGCGGAEHKVGCFHREACIGGTKVYMGC